MRTALPVRLFTSLILLAVTLREAIFSENATLNEDVRRTRFCPGLTEKDATRGWFMSGAVTDFTRS